jgi:hypothetical protein
METPSHPPKKVNVAISAKSAIQVGIAVVLIGISFYGGIAYQKSKTSTASSDSSTQMGANGQGFGNGQMGPRGQMMTVSEVTAISGTSITVKGNADSKTYTISGDTSIIKDGAVAATTDIAVGDNVAVMASSADATMARRIIINPQQGGMMNGGPQTNVQSN